MVDHYEYQVATYFVNALINNDPGGLDAKDLELLDIFEISAFGKLPDCRWSHWTDSREGVHFARCDITGLYAEVLQMDLVFKPKSA
jgi:hypothetical protein